MQDSWGVIMKGKPNFAWVCGCMNSLKTKRPFSECFISISNGAQTNLPAPRGEGRLDNRVELPGNLKTYFTRGSAL